MPLAVQLETEVRLAWSEVGTLQDKTTSEDESGSVEEEELEEDFAIESENVLE